MQINFKVDAVEVLVQPMDGLRADEKITDAKKKEAEKALNTFIKCVQPSRTIVGAGSVHS